MYEMLTLYHSSAPDRFTTVTVAAAGGDYTTIKAAIAAVTPTEIAPVKIYVRNGTYNEIQMDGTDYLTIEGESQSGVIIVSDGLREDVDPVSGQRYVDMAEADKHGFLVYHTMTFRNLTIRVNDVKYCIHADHSGAYTLTLDNVKLQHSTNFPMGVGAWASQHIVANNVTFEKLGANKANGLDGSHGIFWHNWDTEAAPASMTVTNGTFINCGVAHLKELGSEQTDLVKFASCTTDDTKGVYFEVTDLYYGGGGGGAVNVPYCINLLTIGGTFPTPIDYVALDRPDLLAHVSIE